MRISDLHLKYTGKVPKTWFDKYEFELASLAKREEQFKEQEKKIRDESVERGRKKVPVLIRKCLCAEFKQLEYDPYDIKAIMHPVDFVVFEGLNAGDKVERITFLSRKAPDREQRVILESIRKTTDNKRYDWKEARITVDGKVSLK